MSSVSSLLPPHVGIPSPSKPAAVKPSPPIPLAATSITEARVTAGHPIVPIGDLAQRSTASAAHQEDGDASFSVVQDQAGRARWQLSLENWHLQLPPLGSRDGEHVGPETVLDVYVMLLARLHAADFPLDSCVRFSGASSIREMGWTRGRKRRSPTGKQYTQLDNALHYLRFLNIASEAVRQRLSTVYGAPVLSANLSILQSWIKSRPGRIADGVVYEARFSQDFVALLRQQDEVVHYPATQYLELSRGTPRALFRYLEALRCQAEEPSVTVRALDVAARLGSTRRDMEQSRLHPMLHEAHVELVAFKRLGALPTWSESSSGELLITYALHDAPSLGELLEASAIRYGVARRRASEWAANGLERLALVLAATAQGIITPTTGVPQMISNYIKSDRPIDAAALPHFAPGRGVCRPVKRCVDFDFLSEAYEETEGWILARPVVAAALRNHFMDRPRPDWVVDGLVHVAAREMRRAESLQDWKRRRGVAAMPPGGWR